MWSKRNLFLSLLICSTSLYAQEFDTLLNDFQKASELSNKTKDEAMGNLIVYTRSDLERMQANTLKDVLKSLRFTGYQENRMAQGDLYNADPLSFNSSSVRIYLNEHELFNPTVGSGMVKFGNIELDFIDHIEIYQGFPSFDQGTEPATIVIRLYSKTAEHDAGGQFKAQVGSYGSNTQSAYYAQEFEDFSYFGYVSRRDNDYDRQGHEGKSLNQDSLEETLYFNLTTENNVIELHSSQSKTNSYMGSLLSIHSPLSQPGTVGVPDETTFNNKYLRLSWLSYFQDKSLILNASVMKSTTDYNILSLDSIDYRPTPIGQVQVNSLDQQIQEDSYTLGLTKKIKYRDNSISVGLKFRHKHFDLTDATFAAYMYTPPGLTSSVPIVPYEQPYYSVDITTAFVQDEYAIDENQLISISFMLQNYHNKHSSVNDENLFQRRLGYVYSNKAWVAKTFFSYEEFAPEPYAVASPSEQYSNVNLDKNTYVSLLQEVSYQNTQSLSRLILGYIKLKDLPLLNESLQIVNSSKDIDSYKASFEETIFFSENDKLELQAYVVMYESLRETGYDQLHGGMIRMLNTVEKFDFFNEYIVREKQHAGTDNGQDYNLGVIYHVTPDLQFNVKGENILNSGYEQSYMTQIDSSNGAIQRVVKPITQRRFWFGMELRF